MPDHNLASDDDRSRFVAAVLALSAFTPDQSDQLTEVADYFVAVEEAVRMLPATDPTTDELAVGFDPSWPEERS